MLIYVPGTALGFWDASVNKIDKILADGVNVLERQPRNEQTNAEYNARWDNYSEEKKNQATLKDWGVTGRGQERFPEWVTLERRPA